MTTLRRYFRDTGQPDPLRQGQGAGVICQYSFSGDSEQYVHLGRDHPFQILIIPPFFEEMNRTRWLLLAAMRTLDEARIGTILPDLPGQNESLAPDERSEEHTSELQSLMRISYAVFCLKKKHITQQNNTNTTQ